MPHLVGASLCCSLSAQTTAIYSIHLTYPRFRNVTRMAHARHGSELGHPWPAIAHVCADPASLRWLSFASFVPVNRKKRVREDFQLWSKVVPQKMKFCRRTTQAELSLAPDPRGNLRQGLGPHLNPRALRGEFRTFLSGKLEGFSSNVQGWRPQEPERKAPNTSWQAEYLLVRWRR